MRYDLLDLYNPDTHGRLLKTFVVLEIDGNRGVYWCHALDDNSFLFFSCPKLVNTIITRTSLERGQVFLETFLPSSGWYQIDGQTSFISARPQRQWKRSLCQATHTIFSPTKTIRINTDFADSISKLNEEQPVFSLEEACQRIKEQDFTSCKMNSFFALTYKGDIYNNAVQVGKLDFDKHSFKLNPVFRDEFSSLTVGSSYKDRS